MAIVFKGANLGMRVVVITGSVARPKFKMKDPFLPKLRRNIPHLNADDGPLLVMAIVDYVKAHSLGVTIFAPTDRDIREFDGLNSQILGRIVPDLCGNPSE